MAPPGACRILLAVLLTPRRVGATRHIGKGSVAAANVGQALGSPESDSRFFKHNYPHDFVPGAPLEKDFDHPYPVVQESDVYDKDFVKDENSDNGEWKAQTEYDRLRTRMERLRVQEHRILKKKENLERKLEARRAEKELLRKTREHSDEMHNNTVRGAEDHMRDAKDSHKKMRADGEFEVGDSSTAVGVTGATKEVEKELEDIEECKKQLAEAQAKLKSLQEEQRKLTGEEGDAQEATTAAEKAQAASEKEESELEAEIKKVGGEHESALSAYERKRDEMLDLENRLEKVQMTLLKFRGSHVDQDGGVYKVETESRAKNGALAHATSLSLLVAVPTMVRAVL
mmetsp:Transcript_112530/g.328918  ORF Transcript_112530/g.328918 Transcript_112530/m.328918 type:complete len:343 (+) Transcript_112530:56-1084(+)